MQLVNFCLYIQYLVLDIPGYQPISTPKAFQTGDPPDYFAYLHFWPLRVRPWCSSPSPCFKSGIEHWRHGLLVFHSIKLVLFKGPSPKGGWLTIEHISASTQDKRIQTSQWHANRKSESEATDRNEDGSVGLFEHVSNLCDSYDFLFCTSLSTSWSVFERKNRRSKSFRWNSPNMFEVQLDGLLCFA